MDRNSNLPRKNGRKKGTPNKVTTFTKIVITNILSDYHTSGLMLQDLGMLEPKDRLHVMLRLMEFVTPKPQSVDMTINAEKRITIEDTLIQLAEEVD